MVGSWNILERFAQVLLDSFLAGHVFPKKQIKQLSLKKKKSKNVIHKIIIIVIIIIIIVSDICV